MQISVLGEFRKISENFKNFQYLKKCDREFPVLTLSGARGFSSVATETLSGLQGNRLFLLSKYVQNFDFPDDKKCDRGR